MPDEQGKVQYEVVDQRPTSRVTSGGRVEDGMEVTIRVNGSNDVPFFVPMGVYTVEVVQSMARAHALNVAQVAALSEEL